MGKTLLSACILLFAAGLSGVSTLRMPDVARAKDIDGTPLWVAASVGIANGELRSELFEPAFLPGIERNRSRNPDRCVSYLGLGPTYGSGSSTIEENVETSYSVVTGIIRKSELGFYRGHPGTLFGLQVTGRPKSFGHSARASVLYLFVAIADIETARGHICAMPLPGTLTPAIGDKAVVFAKLPAQDENGEIFMINGQSTLILERNGMLLGGIDTKTGPARDLAAVLSAVERSDGLTREPLRRHR